MDKIKRARGGVLSVIFLGVASLLLVGCGAAESSSVSPTPASPVGAQSEASHVIVLGNIDASNPSKKIAEFQPLADYLAANLESFGIGEGRVVIAQDTAEMARLLTDEDVDLYIDATIPSLEVCQLAGCDLVLRQWKGGSPELAGVFVTSETSGVASVHDLTGKVIMLEQPHSTVGHILPLVTIVEQGITVRQVGDPQAPIADDEVGYYVSSGGQTSMNLLLNGEIAALAIGERAFEQFSPDVQGQVVIFDRTIAAPSQLVTVRPGFDPDLEREIVDLMIALEQSAEGEAILEGLRDTQKFDALPTGTDQQLAELYEVVQRTTQE